MKLKRLLKKTWYVVNGDSRSDKIIARALGLTIPFDRCPSCQHKGPHVRHNTTRMMTCTACGNNFMAMQHVNFMYKSYAHTVQGNEGPQIDHVCPVKRCQSKGPFVLEQGTNYTICTKCGNVSVPVSLAKDLVRQLESSPFIQGRIRALGAKEE